jgi:copper chaperone
LKLQQAPAISAEEENPMEIIVKGMSCGHCAAAVTRALAALPGVSDVQVDLTSGRVSFAAAGPVPMEELARVIKAAGYEVSMP